MDDDPPPQTAGRKMVRLSVPGGSAEISVGSHWVHRKEIDGHMEPVSSCHFAPLRLPRLDNMTSREMQHHRSTAQREA
jgi:hypothetical protein